MEDIRIAYFIDRIIRGGTELQVVEQINRFAERGVKQILFCLYKSEEHDSIPSGCRTEILDVRSLARPSTFIKMKRVADILKRERINVVQTYFFDSTVLGVMCGRMGRVKRVVSCRRDLGFWYTKNLLRVLRILNFVTDGILVNSRAVEENVATRECVKRLKIRVIPNGIDVERYRYSPADREKARKVLNMKPDERCVSIVANMSREVKRVDLFIEAARILSSKGTKARYFILGDGYLRAGLEERRDRYALGDRVVFLGNAFLKDDLLAATDIGVISSDSEGFSNSIMEYMAAGALCVVSDVEGNRELVCEGETGFLFQKGDAGDLARTISKALDDGSGKNEIIERARKKISRYDWTVRIDEMLAFYGDLVCGK